MMRLLSNCSRTKVLLKLVEQETTVEVVEDETMSEMVQDKVVEDDHMVDLVQDSLIPGSLRMTWLPRLRKRVEVSRKMKFF